MQDKTKGNPTNFKVGSNLSSLFEKAKEHNHLNALIKAQFSEQFKGLNLCFLGSQSATLLAKNSSIAFRAEKQKTRNDCTHESDSGSAGHQIGDC